MQFFSRNTTATLLGAAFGIAVLASPLTAALADGQATGASGSAHQSASIQAKMRGETVEQRINTLHKALKITPDEESNWSSVAQAMRDNDAAMHRLASERDQTAQKVSAVDDLRTYEKFTQAHVDGLKTLIASFETLYDTMPDNQKAIADRVFQSFGRPAQHAHS